MSPRMSEVPPSSAEQPRERLQFTLQSMIGLFVVVALLLGYLRTFSGESILRCGAVTLASLAIGALLGLWPGKVPDTMFWAAIGAVFGFLTVLGDASYHWSLVYVWPMVGGVTGATAALAPQHRLVRRMAVCGLVAMATIGLYLVCFLTFERAMVADMCCAALGGALMAVAVELATRFERFTSLPRYLLASAFVVVGIAGHWAAFHFLPHSIGY